MDILLNMVHKPIHKSLYTKKGLILQNVKKAGPFQCARLDHGEDSGTLQG